MKVTQVWPTWGRRLSFAAVLLVAAITPGTAAGWSSVLCPRARCESAGTIRWIRPDQDAVLLAICGQVAARAAGTAIPRCTRPELAVVNR